MSKEEQEKQGFTVRDRRRFSESGEARPESDEGAAEDAAPPSPGTAAAQDTPQSAPRSAAAAMELNFSTFVISLSTQALAHLGDIPNPVDRQNAVDLSAAKQLIDILGVLKDKTKGNLDKAETELLDGLLYDLRIRYVERVRGRPEGT